MVLPSTNSEWTLAQSLIRASGVFSKAVTVLPAATSFCASGRTCTSVRLFSMTRLQLLVEGSHRKTVDGVTGNRATVEVSGNLVASNLLDHFSHEVTAIRQRYRSGDFIHL